MVDAMKEIGKMVGKREQEGTSYQMATLDMEYGIAENELSG
jgi:hypothetical protein